VTKTLHCKLSRSELLMAKTRQKPFQLASPRLGLEIQNKLTNTNY